jgi:hypothetical protein
MRLLSVPLLLFLFQSCVRHDLSPDVFDCNESDLTTEVIETSPASGCDASDGLIRVDATGGTPPYSFQINNTTNTSGRFDALNAGIYSVRVSDARGCAAEIGNVLINATGFAFGAEVHPNTDCIGGNGSIAITVQEGQSPFEFSFAGGDFSEVSTFTALADGTYEIAVRDASNCSAFLSVTVPKGETGTSWSAEIRPLMTTYCALTGCHNGVSRPDLRLYDKAKFYAKKIKELTQDGSMPFEGSLTQNQIDLIACWVDEGAKDN